MAFRTDESLISRDIMLSDSDAYDATTVPSNEVKITASDASAYGTFGSSVSVGCGLIVIGSYNDKPSGEAYIFDLDGNQLVKITSPGGAIDDNFGRSVAIGCGRIVVGANEDDDNGSFSGSAYIFDLNGNQLAKITAADGAANDFFGASNAIGSGRIVVGAYKDDSNKGSAYIFDLDGNQLAKITASDGAAADDFGRSVSVGSGRIVVGAYANDSFKGAAYLFDLDGNQLAKITASDGAAGDGFGLSVAVGFGRIVVGAWQDDDNGSASGSAYIFDLNGNQLAKITASDGAAGDWFGIPVTIGSGRIIVGAYADDDNGTSSGSAYIFDLDGKQLAKITATDAAAGDQFGNAVAIGSGRIVVGAYADDDNGTNSGSAYIYTTPEIKHILDLTDEIMY